MAIQHKLKGFVRTVLLGLEHDSLITTPVDQAVVTFAGFEGDRHAGVTRKSDSRTPHYPRGTEIRNDRQVSIISVEEMQRVAEALELHELRPEWIGANLLIEGIPNLSQLPPNTRLFFSEGVVLVVSAENHPCRTAGRALEGAVAADKPAEAAGLTDRFAKAARSLRGIVACVERPGTIQTGEAVEAWVPEVGVYRPQEFDKDLR